MTINVLTVEKIKKSYGINDLFNDLTFTITDQDKIGLIGINGTGKSTMLRIIAGIESPDSGTFTKMKNLRISFLSQNPPYNPEATILENVFEGDSKELKIIQEYESLLDHLSQSPDDQQSQDRLLVLSSTMKELDLWGFETMIKTILTKLGIHNFHQKMKELSGGQRKRVALASVLIKPSDLLILDEPTNHMDNETIAWLEDFLTTRKGALLMVTHDRYFLDRITNRIIELDSGDLYSYDGNYSIFVEKKAERRALAQTLEQKRLNTYKTELAWMRRGALARSTKQKARIQRFEALKDNSFVIDEKELEIPTVYSRLGNKIIEVNDISLSYNHIKYIDEFSYHFLRNDRIGIVGDNGTGKTTLLDIITGEIKPNNGTVDIGSTVKIGYYHQHFDDMPLDIKAIDYIQEVAVFIESVDGNKITASQMMETFLFSKEMQHTLIEKLSGGERRRLYLLYILIQAPNILILDEPTNDLDLDTLKVLENYLDYFNGCVICVSHDRYFLDRVCKRIFAFEGHGQIRENTGNYSDYVDKISSDENVAIKTNSPAKSKKQETVKEKNENPKKLSYKEKMEFEQLPNDIEDLETKLLSIEEEISITKTDYTKLQSLVEEKDLIELDLLEKMEKLEEYENRTQ